MFFADHEKKVYRPEWSSDGFDPIRLERLLVFHSDGQLYRWVEDRNAASRDDGDVSAQGRAEKEKLAAMAELQLAGATRKAFEFSDDLLDGEVLERLYGFLEYMGGKGEMAGKPCESEESSPISSQSETTAIG